MSSNNRRFGPSEAFGAPPRTGRFWFDLLAATAAIFISVVSLVVAFRGEETQRGLLAANSWPFLLLSKDRTTDESKLDVENSGVGPAKIFTFEVFYKGQPVDNAIALLQSCCGAPAAAKNGAPPPLPGLGFGSVAENVLRPGEHILALRLRRDPASDIFARFNASMPDLTFRACYCSILKECWTGGMQSLEQTPVPSCPAAAHPFLMGRGHEL